MNLYAYVANDPLNATDPDGRQRFPGLTRPPPPPPPIGGSGTGSGSEQGAGSGSLGQQLTDLFNGMLNRQDQSVKEISEATTDRRSNDRMTIYRAVGAEELAVIGGTGNYGHSPHQAGKYFAMTEQGVRNFASNPAVGSVAVTRTTVPMDIARKGFGFIDPGPTGAGASIHFTDDVLEEVYKEMTPVEILE